MAKNKKSKKFQKKPGHPLAPKLFGIGDRVLLNVVEGGDNLPEWFTVEATPEETKEDLYFLVGDHPGHLAAFNEKSILNRLSSGKLYPPSILDKVEG